MCAFSDRFSERPLSRCVCVAEGAFMDPLKPEELRARARELLTASMMATDPERRASLVQLAAYYEELAVKLDALTSPLGQLHDGRRPYPRQ